MTLLGWSITIDDFSTLVVLVVAVAIDLSIRYLAFGDVESVAIDAALFGAVASGLELARQVSANGPEISQWVQRTGWGLLFTLVLAGAHKMLKDTLHANARERLQVAANDASGVAKNALHHIPNVVIMVIQLTFIPEWRRGKTGRRNSLATYLNTLSPKSGFTEEHFRLRRWEMNLALLGFSFGGFLGLLAPVISISRS
jgi:hypothetical protein